MAKKKLLEDIRSNPARYYRLPGDVIRDRRFSDPERLEILQAWQQDADTAVVTQIQTAITELEGRDPVHTPHHAAE